MEMEGLKLKKQKSYGNCKFASTAITITTFASASNDDSCVEPEILEGILTATAQKQNDRKVKRRKHIKLSLPPETEMGDELLEEASPKTKIHPAEEEKAKALTMDEYVALRIGLQDVIQSDMKEKMTLLRDQLSEYHAVLKDAIALNSRCEGLEQEKQDLISFCREACQMRDDKIALLEKALVQLRDGDELQSGSRSDGSGASTFIGIQQTPLIKPHMPTLMRDHNHHNFCGRLPVSPISVPYRRSSDKNKSDGLSKRNMTPTISNSKTKTPHMSEINQKGGFVSDFDDTSFKSISIESRSAKTNRHSRSHS